MLLYKYRSSQNLWLVLDIILNNRLYCAKWSELNDPLEGRYEVLFNQKFPQSDSVLEKIENRRNEFRIASLSSDPRNFLLWSHYADGHKGLAIEMEIHGSHRDLFEVVYTPFSSIFSSFGQIKNGDMRHIFNGKTEEWSYEKEWRIICKEKFFCLPNPVKRVFLGPLFDREKKDLLRRILPQSIELVEMELDRVQCEMRPLR